MRTMTAAALALALAVCGCSREDGKGGPGEKAGRQLDRALDKAGQAVEQAGRDMQKSSKGEPSKEGK